LRRAEPALPVFAAAGRAQPLVVRRIANARQMRLVVDPRSGEVRLTLPRRAALGHALAWAERQRDWVERALADLPSARPIAAGATIPFEDRPLRIEWRADWPRRVVHREAEGVLRLGGAAESIAPRVLRWLRGEALLRLEHETRALAARAGVTIGRVGVGDPRSRWGSCSASGDIRYSWRLILAPPAVREATVAHEVAHRLHMDHGPAFHAAVARLLGREPVAERAWLRTEGAALYWLGRAP
jgi:predicted metal-dependent hydrolase